ncbi:MAG: hypothetical protein AAF602_11915, partial [Myxococcota bacterium]
MLPRTTAVLILAACAPAPEAPPQTTTETEILDPEFDFPVAPSPDGDHAPKATPGETLAALRDRVEVPSVFGAAFVRLGRAWASGRTAEGELEADAFAIFDELDPGVQDAVRRTVAAVDALPEADAAWLYDEAVLADAGPLTTESLADAV